MPSWDLSKDIELLFKVLEIREQNGYDFPRDLNNFKVNIIKSALMHRLLDGKDPLPIPPPKSMSYPWYSLIEDGYGHPYEVWKIDNKISTPITDYPAIIIDQSPWKILEELKEDEWIVTYPYGYGAAGLNRIKEEKFAEGKWHVYPVGSRVPQSKMYSSSNKLWEIKKIE